VSAARRRAPGSRAEARARPNRPALKGRRVPPAVERIRPILRKLRQRYPDARCALHHESALELLVATILSAQCTDVRVNLVTRELFQKYRSAADYAAADPAVFEQEIKSTGFFRNKTKSVLGMARALLERHGGEVPDTLPALVALPGVGRKTANVVLGTWFRKNEGVVVDTHVTRLSQRLGLTRQRDAVKIEQDLMRLVPRPDWTDFSHLMIHHGRQVCDARKPRCEICPVNLLCPSSTAGRR
jgi:endonuclease-3